jgi:hypothetical protein
MADAWRHERDSRKLKSLWKSRSGSRRALASFIEVIWTSSPWPSSTTIPAATNDEARHDDNNAPLVLAIGGLLIGFVFGAVVYRTNYCAMGSLSDIDNFGDYRRFRAWILAAATALVGATLLSAAGIVALDQSMYLASTFNWLGYLAGGVMFGVGMVFAGGCPSRNLARAGAGVCARSSR